MTEHELESRLRADLADVAERIDPIDRFDGLDAETGVGPAWPTPAAAARGRLLAAAAAVVVVGLAATGLAVQSRGGDVGVAAQPEDTASSEQWCQELAREVVPGVVAADVLLAAARQPDLQVLMDVDADREVVDAVGSQLGSEPAVASIGFLTQDVQYEQFRTLFADRPEFLENVSPDVLPPSYTVSLVAGSTKDDMARVASDVESLPGVRQVYRGTPPFLHSTIEDLDTPSGQERRPEDLQRLWRAWTTSLRRIAAATPASSKTEIQKIEAFHDEATRRLEAARWSMRPTDDLQLDEPRSLVDAARSVERDIQQRCETAGANDG